MHEHHALIPNADRSALLLAGVYQAISYRAINAAVEPGDRWLFANEYGECRERAHRLAYRLL